MAKPNKALGGGDAKTELADAAARPPQLDPAVVAKIAEVRAHVREAFGKTVMSMMMLPRYRNQTLGDLQHLVLEPLIRDRIAIAYPGAQDPKVATDSRVAPAMEHGTPA